MAVTTFTTNASNASRLVVAFGAELGLGRNATEAEIKTATIAWWRSIVRNQERKIKESVITDDPPLDVT